MLETELKLLIDADVDKRLRARLSDPALAADAVTRTRLHAIYYDTVERALAAQRIALRVRKQGRRWVQCVKIGGPPVAGLSCVQECEAPAPGGRLSLAAIPDAATRERVTAAVGAAALAPVCETVIARTTAALRGPHGGVVALALDEGEIRAGDAAAPLREAELELISGDVRDVYAVAKLLFAHRPMGAPVRFSTRNKARRGSIWRTVRLQSPIRRPWCARRGCGWTPP